MSDYLSKNEEKPITGNYYQHTWHCECYFNSQSRSKEPCNVCSNRSIGIGNCKESYMANHRPSY